MKAMLQNWIDRHAIATYLVLRAIVFFIVGALATYGAMVLIGGWL